MAFPRITRGQIGAIAAGLVVVAGTFWLRSTAEKNNHAPVPFHAPERSNYYARDILIHSMNALGQPLYTLHADLMKQYPDNSADMDHVRMKYMGNRSSVRKRGTWHLTSDHAHRPAGGKKRVRFHGHVIVDGATAKGKPLTLHTPTLTVFMKSKKMETKASVRLDSGPSQLTAIGMHGNMNTEKLHFMKDVHATFVPE